MPKKLANRKTLLLNSFLRPVAIPLALMLLLIRLVTLILYL
nr:MAG TPA: hypothetical protein [Bacteriophage sp.]